MRFKPILIFLFFLILIPISFAHESTLDEQIKSNSIMLILIATFISLAFVIYANHARKEKHYTNNKKRFLFLGIIIPIIIATTYLVVGTIYIDSVSVSKGPVHWHTDFEIHKCEQRIDIIDPTGLSNRVGTPVFHEHNDDRIHIEGVIVEENNVWLQRFFAVIGGSLTETSFSIPTNYGEESAKNGDLCDGEPSILQAFVYKTNGNDVTQEKITPHEMLEYVPSPYSLVPPGDCVIIEFAPEKESTNHICTTYRIAIEKGVLNYGS